MDGFVDNIRYRSLIREGWVLSLSGWRDEKSVVRWRTRMRHHIVQEKGRGEIFSDYHLRVGRVTQDTRLPEGCVLHQQRLDETEVGAGSTVTLIDARRPAERAKETKTRTVAEWLGLAADMPGLVGWDVFAAVLTPGDIILLMSWRDKARADAFERRAALPDGTRSAMFASSGTTACSIATKRRNTIPTQRASRRSIDDRSMTGRSDRPLHRDRRPRPLRDRHLQLRRAGRTAVNGRPARRPGAAG